MIPKISSGKGVRGLSNYLFGPGENKKLDRAKLIGGNMTGTDPRELAREFAISRQLRPKTKNPIWHCSLSQPPGETLTQEQWSQAAQLYLQKMKINPENHMWYMVRHDDTEHDHVHLVVSRIGLDGKLWSNAQDVKKAIKSCRAIEKEMGLSITQEKIKGGKRLSSKEIQMGVRTGQTPARVMLQKIIKKELVDKPTTNIFLERMEQAGVEVRPNIATTGRVTGISFEYDGISFKGSKLGKTFSWTGLQKQGLQYDQDRDTEILRAAKEKTIFHGGEITPEEIEQVHEKKYTKTLDLAFSQDEKKADVFAWKSRPDRIAFTDHGDRISYNTKNKTAIKAGVQLAQAKGWTTLKIISTDKDFILESYKAARGLGYDPDKILIKKSPEISQEIEKIEKEIINGQNSRRIQSSGNKGQEHSGTNQGIETAPGERESERRGSGPEIGTPGPGHGDPDRERPGIHRNDRKKQQEGTRETLQGNRIDNSGLDGTGSNFEQNNGGDDLSRTKVGISSKSHEKGRERDHYQSVSHGNSPGFVDRDSDGSRIVALSENALHQEQGHRRMGPERRKDRDRGDASVKAAHLIAKEKSWERQAAALDSPGYRITLTHPDPEKKGFNLGKSKEQNGPEQFFSNEDVKEKIPFLSAKNAQGYNIYITPIDARHHFMVLDDTNQEKFAELKKHGFKPALTQESSPGNIQAIFKVPRDESNIDEQRLANGLVQRINKSYGDPKFTGVVHPFRLAGFTNAKPKHKDERGNSPFVKVLQGSGEFCSKMDKLLSELRTALQEKVKTLALEKIKVSAQQRKERIQNIDLKRRYEPRGLDADLTQVQFRFLQERKKWEELAKAKGWPLDDSKMDFRACKAIVNYYGEEATKQALIKCSPAIETRHTNWKQYAEITVQKAIQNNREEQKNRKTNSRGPQSRM